MARSPRLAAVCAAALAAGAAAATTAAAPAVPAGARLVERTVATDQGTRPVHMIRVTPGGGAHIEAVWLGGRPGRTGTVGGYVRARPRKALGGMNGDFFLLQGNVTTNGGVLHKGQFAVAGKGFAAFLPDGSVRIGEQSALFRELAAEGVTPREGIGGKPLAVVDGVARGPGALSPEQANGSYHRTAIARMKNGDTALIVIGGAGLTHRSFARALVKLGVDDALGQDLNSSANLVWLGRTINRTGFERQIPAAVIVMRTG